MKILNEEYRDVSHSYASFDFYFKNSKIGIFDIETTGLSPLNSQIILSGFVLPQDDDVFLCKQIFSQNLEEEEELLKETIKVLENLDVIITYNGARFDVPFFLKRLEQYNLHCNHMPYNLDLYRVVKNYSEIRKFTPNLTQKTLESYLGLWTTRDDLIDGKISVDMYFQYLHNQDENLERQILLHNSDDVKQLYRILACIPQTDFHRSMCKYGFPFEQLLIENIKLQKKKLSFTGTIKGKPIYYSCYNDDARYNAIFDGNKFQIEIATLTHENLIFVDLDAFGPSIGSFENCEGLSDHYLVLSVNKEPISMAITMLIQNLLKEILSNQIIDTLI